MLLSKIEDENKIYKYSVELGKYHLFFYKYKNFDIILENIIKLFYIQVSDGRNKPRQLLFII